MTIRPISFGTRLVAAVESDGAKGPSGSLATIGCAAGAFAAVERPEADLVEVAFRADDAGTVAERVPAGDCGPLAGVPEEDAGDDSLGLTFGWYGPGLVRGPHHNPVRSAIPAIDTATHARFLPNTERRS